MIRLVHVDPYRVEAWNGDRRVAYAIVDGFGWALMAKVWREARRDTPAGWVCSTVARVDYGSIARRNARVGRRLLELFGIWTGPPAAPRSVRAPLTSPG